TDRREADRHRQQVGGEAGERQRDKVHGLRALVHPYPEAPHSRVHPGTGGGQLVEGDLQVARFATAHPDVAPRHGRAPGPGVRAAQRARARATIRSPPVRGVTGSSRSTPSTTSCDVPAPSILAPIAVSIAQMSTISGSRATLSILVVPLASTAAISRFSVAP